MYFEDSFKISDIPKKEFYLLIRTNPYYLENKNDDLICSELQLNDILEEKINNIISDINNQLDKELLNNNFYNKFTCIICKKSKKENKEELLYYEDKNSKNIKCIHKSCNDKILNEHKNLKCFKCQKIKKQKKEPLYYFENNKYFHESCNPIIKKLSKDIIELEKYKIYESLKNNIILKKKYKIFLKNVKINLIQYFILINFFRILVKVILK